MSILVQKYLVTLNTHRIVRYLKLNEIGSLLSVICRDYLLIYITCTILK